MEIEKNNFTISINQLDKEWLNQSAIYFEYAEQENFYSSELKKLKDKLEIFYCESDLKIRDLLKNEKTTEAIIKAKILSQPEYSEIVNKINDVYEKQGIFSAACRALDHKKKALENLVQLWLSNYFSAPSSNSENVKNKILETVENDNISKLNGRS